MEHVDDFDYHITNNTLVKFFTEKRATFTFLLNSTIASMFSSRSEKTFNPVPPDFIDMDIVNSEIQSLNILEIMTEFKEDHEAKNSFGDSMYNFLVFMILSNTMNMIPTVLLKLGDYHEESIHPIPQFKIEHSVSSEKEFRDKVSTVGNISTFLYHGSRKENWYSIMRNGLKVYSHDKEMMLNGSSYGCGIYLSDNFNTSMHYCTTATRIHSCSGTKSGSDKENDFVIGIFEVVGPKAAYKKAENIYVVQDESLLLIRYLIHFPNKESILTFGVSETLNEKFNRSLKNDIKQKSIVLNRIAQKRLLTDFKKIQKINVEQHINIRLRDDENLAIWDVYLNGFLTGSRIEQDLAKFGYKGGVHIEIRFPEDYPNHPPFIRVVSPRFEVMTGHVTSGGSVCMEVLTNQGWRPSYCLESLMVDVRQMILDGNGGLDARFHAVPYTLEEAYRAFDRMSATHGWY